MQFTDTKFMTAKEKEMTLKQWVLFLKNGLKEDHFTKRIYDHLIQHCSFIAHFSRSGFYSTYFDIPENTIKFLKQFDTTEGCVSTEYGDRHWVNNSDYADINQAMCSATDTYKAHLYMVSRAKITGRDVMAGVALLKKEGITPEQYAQLIGG